MLDTGGARLVAAATVGTTARRIKGATSVYALASEAISANTTLPALLDKHGYGEEIDLTEALRHKRILAPVDHSDTLASF